MSDLKNFRDEFLRGKIAEEFDFYKIRETVSEFAASEEGKSAVQKRESTSDGEKINFLKNLGKEWSLFLNENFSSAIKSWPPVKEIFPLLKIGASLSQEQIFSVGLFALYSRQAKDEIFSAAKKIKIPLLEKNAEKIQPLDECENEIFSVLEISTGKLRDLKSLRVIREKIAACKKEISSALKKYTSDSSLSSALQSNVPALRNDRELLAVKSDHRNSVRGIIHEVSDSGRTIFVEPEEIVRANNNLVQEEFALAAETKKILRELSEKISVFSEALEKNLQTMILLDETLAAAKYKNSVNGIFAEDCAENESPKIIGARHPLLGNSAVPVTMNFPDGKKIVIVTGANTGGKTVSLKTAALFVLMNQASFPIPASDGTKLPLFDSVFADLGDEQSIENSLSTFSGHMKKIAFALENASEKSLVLLDELGSGTDPLEGSAIAMSILDSLLKKNSFVIATTHHGVLKNFGWTNPECTNASVEFDAETFKPTYNFVMGIPGESHAIDIAKNSGMPADVIEKARECISTEQADVSSLIKGLTEKHRELDSVLNEQKEKQAELLQKEFKMQKKEAELLEKEIELSRAEHAESSAFLVQTRSRLENLVRVIREGEITREKTLGVRNFISGLTDEINLQEEKIAQKEKLLSEQKENLSETEQKISENGIRFSKSGDKKNFSSKKTKRKISNSDALKNAVPVFAEEKISAAKKIDAEKILSEGTEVLAGREKRKGILIRRVKEKIWQVQIGAMKMNFPEEEISLCRIPPEQKFDSVFFTIEKNPPEKNSMDAPKFELRLLGMRSEDALKSLQKQLDACVLSGFKKFSVIHGKGNGVLQKTVHDYLNHFSAVKEFHFAPPEDGGSGKTYVELF